MCFCPTYYAFSGQKKNETKVLDKPLAPLHPYCVASLTPTLRSILTPTLRSIPHTHTAEPCGVRCSEASQEGAFPLDRCCQLEGLLLLSVFKVSAWQVPAGLPPVSQPLPASWWGNRDMDRDQSTALQNSPPKRSWKCLTVHQSYLARKP